VNYLGVKPRGFLLRRRNFHPGGQSGSRLHRRSPALGRFGPSPAYRVRWAYRYAPFRTPRFYANPVLTLNRVARPITPKETGGWTITLTRFSPEVKPRGTLAVLTVDLRKWGEVGRGGERPVCTLVPYANHRSKEAGTRPYSELVLVLSDQHWRLHRTMV
jgi:hypothetical protein